MNEQTINDKIQRLGVEVGNYKKSIIFSGLFFILILVLGSLLQNQVSNIGIAFIIGIFGFLSIVLVLFSFIMFLDKRIKLNVLKSSLVSGEYSEYPETKKPLTFSKTIKGALLLLFLVFIGFPLLIFIISSVSSAILNF